MSKWEELSEATRGWMRLDNFNPTTRASDKRIKGYLDEGQVYLCSDELREIAAAYVEVAVWLDLRAGEENINKEGE